MNRSYSVSTDTKSYTDLSYDELLVTDWQSCNERLAQSLSTEDEAQALHYRDCIEQQMCEIGLMVDSTR